MNIDTNEQTRLEHIQTLTTQIVENYLSGNDVDTVFEIAFTIVGVTLAEVLQQFGEEAVNDMRVRLENTIHNARRCSDVLAQDMTIN